MLRVAHFFKKIEVGIDEAGRGPLFGRVYAAAVILNPELKYDDTLIKDSKKISKKKILESEKYVKNIATDWSIGWCDEKRIDKINVLHATQEAMHKAIDGLKINPEHILVDGNYWKHYKNIPCLCVIKGDATYFSIAAASILAKTARDRYIEELCDEHSYLDKLYGIRNNKGYGTAKHIHSIEAHGITQWHRRSFGICKKY